MLFIIVLINCEKFNVFGSYKNKNLIELIIFVVENLF